MSGACPPFLVAEIVSFISFPFNLVPKIVLIGAYWALRTTEVVAAILLKPERFSISSDPLS